MHIKGYGVLNADNDFDYDSSLKYLDYIEVTLDERLRVIITFVIKITV